MVNSEQPSGEVIDDAPLLRVSGLSKSVGAHRALFSGLDLCVERGEIVAIRGESGTGKSTLLNIIAGLDSADSGNVMFEGVEIGPLGDIERTRLRGSRFGFVFQAFHLLPYLTVEQNVALPLVLARVPQAEALHEAREIVKALDLAAHATDYPSTLSGGELQRTAIARALVHGPDLILADEPTGNLDSLTAVAVLNVFVRQVRARSAAAIVVTHSNIVAEAADRVLHLTPGGLSAGNDH